MAVKFEGFSIREYASKMRSVDVVKCWPFGGGSSDETRKEDVEASLPPITVKKFRWWSDLLEVERSKENGESSKASCNETAFEFGNIEAEEMEVALELSKTVLDRENEKLESVCSVKLKAKSRTQKKRSIVEIFAVAPQVERVDDDDEDEYEYDDEEEDSSEENEVHNSKVLALCDVLGSYVEGNEKKNKKKKKKKTKKKKKPKLKDETMSKLKKSKKMNKIKKKGLKIGRDRLVQSIAKKEKPHKLKLHSAINIGTKPNSSSDGKGLRKGIVDAVTSHKKKPRVKCSATHKKNKLLQTSKLIKQQKTVFPVRSILKNKKKGISGEHPMVCNSKISSQVNQFGSTQVDRRVRFSDKDDILGPRRKDFSSVDCPKVPNVCGSNYNAIPAASVKDHGIERGKDLTIEVDGSDEDVSISTENETEVQPVSERQLSDTCYLDTPNFLRPHMGCQEHLSDRSMTVNQVALRSEDSQTIGQGYRDASHEPLYACSPRFPSLPKEGYNPSVNTQVGADILRASNTSDRLIEYQSGDPTSSAAAVCSMGYVKAFPPPSSSYFAMNGNTNGRLPCPSQNTTVNYNNKALQYQPFRHLSPKELMRSICSFPDWKQRAVTGKEKCMDEDFCGLPLNSHGEIIQFNSIGKGMFNHLIRPPTSTVTGSSRSLAVHNMLTNGTVNLSNFKDTNYVGGAPTVDQLKVFPVRSCVKENPNIPVSSRLGFHRLQGTERTDVHCFDSVDRLESDLELMNISQQGHNQYNQVQNQIGDGKGNQQGNSDHVPMRVTQPTMRLMGKEFTVGRSAKDLQAYEDGKVWTDKQIIAEHRQANTAMDSLSLGRQLQQDLIVHSASGKLKENVACLSEPQINQASQSTIQMKNPGSGFSYPYLNCKTDTGYPNCYPTISGNHISQLHPYLPSAASPPLFSRTPLLQEAFISGYESLKLNAQIPKLASTPRRNMSSQNKQKLHHATKSAFEFPFLHPDCGEHVQRPSWFQSSSKSLPPWLLSATQQKETSLGSCQSYSDVGGKRHSCTMSGTSLRNIPSVPEVSYPYNPMSSNSAMQNFLGPAPFAHHPPPMPLSRGFIQTSGINKIHGDRMKFKERMIPRVSVKEPFQGKKTRKRPAAKSDDSAKLTKIPKLTVEEDSSIAALELDSIRGKARSVGCGVIETRTDELGVSPAVVDTFNVDGIARSGPIKLSAGAKHILKPSSNLNQDNSKPTHSTVPFAAATSSGRVSESEKKSAQIYRF
ncbi:hypothetical protein ACSBR2_027206 [Camellia fascicularis]